MSSGSELRALFDSRARHLPGHGLTGLSELRREALDRFLASGFAETGERHWQLSHDRNITVCASTASASTHSARTDANTIDTDLLNRYRLADAWRLVFIDGQFSPEHSQRDGLPQAVTVLTLEEALTQCPQRLQTVLEQSLNRDEVHPLTDWVTTWFDAGSFIEIPDNLQLERPLQLLSFTTAGSRVMQRHVISLGRNAEATVLTTWAGQGDEAAFTGTTTDIVLGENAGLYHGILQVEAPGTRHYGSVHVHNERAARFRQHHIALGAARSLTGIEVELARDSECELEGLFFANGTRHTETTTRIGHTAPHATSRENYRGLATDRATGCFGGRIVVHPGAEKTVAEMQNRNLLLSADAEIDSTPQLEIHADDVRCSHGVTVGQLAADAVFFLMARGLDEAEARTMLGFAFAYEIIGTIPDDAYRHQVLDALLAAMPQSNIRQDWL